MKTPIENTPLDIFIKESLKADDINIPPFDWSEIEVLLRREPKSIPVEINKKTAAFSIAGVLGILLIIGLVKIVQHYSSLPSDPATEADSTQSSFILVDTTKPATVDVIKLKADTLKLDTVSTTKPVNNIDFLKANSLADSAALKATNDKIATVSPKVEKKKKVKNAQKDSSIINSEILPVNPLPIIDTSTKPSTPEIKIDLPTSDTANKKIVVPKNSSKKKKTKTSKNTTVAPEQPVSVPIPALPSDSLK